MGTGSELNVAGRVWTPADPGYDEARQGWNLMFSHRPRLVVEAASVDDVAATVRYAAATGAKLAVQATGHGFATTHDDTVLLLTGALDRLDIDAERAVATVGAGLSWGPVLAAAQGAGLAPLLGSSPDVGAVAYTMGGGFGWLGRRYGLATDHVRTFTVVLADGSVTVASAESQPDLFWALRGAGPGSLGVVTEMEIDLFGVTEVYAGNLFYPLEDAADVFDFYRGWSEGLPEEITTSFVVVNFPPMDIVPEPFRGNSFSVIRGCHSGDPADAEKVVDQVRRWRPPLLDAFGPMPFSESATISADPVDPLPAFSSCRWLTGLGPDVLEAALELAAPPTPVIFAEIRHAGGAVSRPHPDACFGPRHYDRLLQAVSIVPEPVAEEGLLAGYARLWDRLEGRIGGAYLNFFEGDERRHAASYFDADTRARLARIKADVDPGDVFGVGLDLTAAPTPV